ncbi:MAG TPA: creatininase family protein [Nitrososphaera sp.]|nr:creatininase family protein [Nitrososphaera sp.]
MMIKKGNHVLWEELSWKDVDKLTKTMKMVIIPTAACEQHGPHLPLAVDTIDCYEVAKKSFSENWRPGSSAIGLWLLAEPGNFPNTLSIRPDIMMRMI